MISARVLEVSESPDPLSPVSCQSKTDPSETDSVQPRVLSFLGTHLKTQPRLTKERGIGNYQLVLCKV